MLSDKEVVQRTDQTLDDDVVTRATIEDILPATADQHIVAGAAGKGVVSGASDQDVIAIAAIGDELDRAGGEPGGFDHVVAGKAVDDDAIEVCFEAGDVDLR